MRETLHKQIGREASAASRRKPRTGCAHCDAGRKVIYLPNDPDALPWHDNGGEKLHPCVAAINLT